jgi:hypothetical protein
MNKVKKDALGSNTGGLQPEPRRGHDRARDQLNETIFNALGALGQISSPAAQHAAARLSAASPCSPDPATPPPPDLAGAIREAVSVLGQSSDPAAQQAAANLQAAAMAARIA